MGKSLIIKGADFSENGMRETVVTVDKSALYNKGGVLITAENLLSQGNKDANYNYIKTDGSAIINATNVSAKIFSSKFDAEDYETLVVTFANLPSGAVSTLGWQIGIGFTDSNDVPIKAYTANSDATGDKIIKVPANYSGKVAIPTGTKWIYITDSFTKVDQLATHKVVLKKVVVS